MTAKSEQRKILTEAISAILRPDSHAEDEEHVRVVLECHKVYLADTIIKVCPEGVLVRNSSIGMIPGFRPRDQSYKS